MSNRSSGERWTWIVGLLLVTAALAGCAQQPAGPGNDTDDGEGAEISETEARASYRQAASILSEGPEDASRVGLSMTFEAENATDGSGSVEALADEDKSLIVMTMSGTFAEGSGTGSSGDIESFVVAQVHKTTFIGAPTSLIGFYNESEEPPEGFDSVDSSPEGPSGGTQSETTIMDDPSKLFEELSEEPPANATISAREITYEGEPALEIEVSYTEEGQSFDLRLVVYTETERPALIEGDASSRSMEGPGQGSFSIEFTYGDDAEHPMEEAVYRLETMTFSSGQPTGFGRSGGDDRFTNRTIQPSQNPGMVPLEEIQVLVSESDSGSSSMGPGGSEPVLKLDAEQGSASNGNVTVTYEDADGDGAASPGDKIVLEDHDPEDNTTYSLNVKDEKTGVRLAPGPGLAAAVVVLGLAARVLRRRD